MFKRYPEITEQSTWMEIDEALYQFERPYYRYCSSGGGCDPSTEYPGWTAERDRLTRIWLNTHPRVTPMVEKPVSFFKKLITFFTPKG